MRNIGLSSPIEIHVKKLEQFAHRLGGTSIDELTLRFGEIPNGAHLDLSTDLSNGCFDEKEYQELETQLGFKPASYISIHMGWCGRIRG